MGSIDRHAGHPLPGTESNERVACVGKTFSQRRFKYGRHSITKLPRTHTPPLIASLKTCGLAFFIGVAFVAFRPSYHDHDSRTRPLESNFFDPCGERIEIASMLSSLLSKTPLPDKNAASI